MATRHGSATVELPSDTEILINRSFEAPRTLVWDLLTTPRHLLRWWGPEYCPLVACEVDLRAGGAWRYVCRRTDGDAQGEELAWHGEYQAIEAPTRIVSTEVFEGCPDAESLNTMTLTEDDGVTTLQTLVRHSSKANRDGHVDSGMEGGMQQTFDRLDDLVVLADTPSERFRRVAGAFGDLVAEVPADAWDRPAPCEGWVARDVVRHLLTWVPGVLAPSGLELPSPPTETDGDGALAPAWEAFAAALQGALDDPEVAERAFDAGPPGELSVETAISMLVTGDVLVHTWDLAAAIGRADGVRLDGVVSREMLIGMQPMDEMLRGSGHYGPKVEVGDDVSTQDALVAFTGRDPGWRPPGAT